MASRPATRSSGRSPIPIRMPVVKAMPSFPAARPRRASARASWWAPPGARCGWLRAHRLGHHAHAHVVGLEELVLPLLQGADIGVGKKDRFRGKGGTPPRIGGVGIEAPLGELAAKGGMMVDPLPGHDQRFDRPFSCASRPIRPHSSRERGGARRSGNGSKRNGSRTNW